MLLEQRDLHGLEQHRRTENLHRCRDQRRGQQCARERGSDVGIAIAVVRAICE